MGYDTYATCKNLRLMVDQLRARVVELENDNTDLLFKLKAERQRRARLVDTYQHSEIRCDDDGTVTDVRYGRYLLLDRETAERISTCHNLAAAIADAELYEEAHTLPKEA